MKRFDLRRVLALVFSITIVGAATAQTLRQRKTAHFDEMHRLICVCDNAIVKNTAKYEKRRKHDCMQFTYEPCNVCGKIWHVYSYINSTLNDEIYEDESTIGKDVRAARVPEKKHRHGTQCYTEKWMMLGNMEESTITNCCPEKCTMYVREIDNNSRIVKVHIIGHGGTKNVAVDRRKIKEISIRFDNNDIPSQTPVDY